MIRRCVLIIDDEIFMRDAIQVVLNDNAFETVTAASGAAGVEWLKQRAFDLIIVDFRLPDINGMDVWSEAKQLQPNSKYILITACPPTDFPERSSEVLCLRKPFSIEDLLGSIHTLLPENSESRIPNPESRI